LRTPTGHITRAAMRVALRPGRPSAATDRQTHHAGQRDEQSSLPIQTARSPHRGLHHTSTRRSLHLTHLSVGADPIQTRSLPCAQTGLPTTAHPARARSTP